MGKKFRITPEDKAALVNIANRLPIYPMLDNKGEFILCSYPIKGSEVIKGGQKTFEKKSHIMGPKKNTVIHTSVVDIKPERTYSQRGYMLTEPYKYLLNAVKKAQGKDSSVLDKACKKYLQDYEISTKKLEALKQAKEKKTDVAAETDI